MHKTTALFAIFVDIIIPIAMKKLGDRIQELRKQKGFTQDILAKKVGISLTQMARYETKGIQPPANVLMKLASIFGTTVDFLVNGATEDKAKAQLKDAELLQQFKEVELLNDKDKSVIKTLIEAFLMRKQLQQIVR
jgi:transcriptional regulator with XRE-family HTH domain